MGAIFGFQERLRTFSESAAQSAICQLLWLMLSCFAWSGTSMNRARIRRVFLLSSPAMNPSFICRLLSLLSFPYSFLSLCPSLPLLLSLPPLHSCLSTSSTSIVWFRQAIYIILPGFLISHSLNKVFFIVFARVCAHSHRTWMCVWACTTTYRCVWGRVHLMGCVRFRVYYCLCFFQWQTHVFFFPCVY